MKKIKEVMKIVGVSKRTLQYYDEIGLMPAKRSKLNYRIYDDSDLERLWEIVIYKEMKLNLGEIGVILNAYDKDAERKRVIDKNMKKINELIDDQQRLLRFMKKVYENGVPDLKSVSNGKEDVAYYKIARVLAERF